MSNYSYFDESLDLTAPSFSVDPPFDLPDRKHHRNILSITPDDGVPTYNSLFDTGSPSKLSFPFGGRITYIDNTSSSCQLPDGNLLLPPKLEKRGPFPGSRLTRQLTLPPYAVSSDDSCSGVILNRSLTVGLSLPPLPQTPPPKYEVRSSVIDSQSTGRRKAVCVGINYYKRSGKAELEGCVNDAKNMQKLLIERNHYRPEDMILLTDGPEQHDRRLLPTRDNIIRAMRWLVHDAQPGDSLVFQFSGHGSQVPDEDGDEDDKLDEVILPIDHKTNGPIVDDEMHNVLVKPLPPGCRLTAVYDSCHSGSALDLPCHYTRDRRRGIVGGRSKRAMPTKSSAADVVCWSACRDSETAADNNSTGVMSSAFISALNDPRGHSYKSLFMAVDNALRADPRISQKPQLSSSHPINITRKFTM